MRFLIILLGVVCLALPSCTPPPELESDLDPEPAPEPVFDQAAEEAATAGIQRMVGAMKLYGVDASMRISSTDSNIPISMGIPAITISRGGVGGGLVRIVTVAFRASAEPPAACWGP